jgi:hypothetical protein
MPITPAQLALGANYQLEAYSSESPVDQFTQNRPFTAWLMAKKVNTVGGNEYFNEKLLKSADSNYQNYYGDDQVTYNRRDPVRLAKFPWANFHDGFGLNEDELARNGIILTDDASAQMTGAEEVQIVNLLKVNQDALKEGVQTEFDLEMHMDGTQDDDAVVGLDGLVSTTPAVGAVGGIDPALAANAYWRNNVNLGISTASAGNLVQEMEETWRATTRYGKSVPDMILVGAAFLDAYRRDALSSIERHNNGGTARGGVTMDPSTSKLYFKGIELVWDPTFETLDDILGVITYPWTKRAYFLSSKHLRLRPLQGHWMVNRKPPRVYDRYVHYWGVTSKYRLTTDKRNAHAVLSIA